MAKGDSGGVPWQCLVSLRTSPAALVPVSGCWVRAITNHTVAVIARTFLYGSEGSEGSIDGTIEPPEPRTGADHLRRGRGGRRARRRPRARRRHLPRPVPDARARLPAEIGGRDQPVHGHRDLVGGE